MPFFSNNGLLGGITIADNVLLFKGVTVMRYEKKYVKYHFM